MQQSPIFGMLGCQDDVLVLRQEAGDVVPWLYNVHEVCWFLTLKLFTNLQWLIIIPDTVSQQNKFPQVNAVPYLVINYIQISSREGFAYAVVQGMILLPFFYIYWTICNDQFIYKVPMYNITECMYMRLIACMFGFWMEKCFEMSGMC